MAEASKTARGRSDGSKGTHGAVALKFIGAALAFVGLLNGILSARAGAGPDGFDAALFVSGLAAVIAGTIKKTSAPHNGARDE